MINNKTQASGSGAFLHDSRQVLEDRRSGRRLSNRELMTVPLRRYANRRKPHA